MVRSTADYDTQRLAGDHAGLDQHHHWWSDARCVLFWLYLLTHLSTNTPFAVAQNHNLNYRSGMLQSWNNFCFTTGYIKVGVVLPRQDANSAGYVSLPLYALFVFPKQVALYLCLGVVLSLLRDKSLQDAPCLSWMLHSILINFRSVAHKSLNGYRTNMLNCRKKSDTARLKGWGAMANYLQDEGPSCCSSISV